MQCESEFRDNVKSSLDSTGWGMLDFAFQQPTYNVAKWRTPAQWWVQWLPNHNDLKSCGCSGRPCCPVPAAMYPHSTPRSGPNLSRFLVPLRIFDDKIFSSLARKCQVHLQMGFLIQMRPWVLRLLEESKARWGHRVCWASRFSMAPGRQTILCLPVSYRK